jgi:hypothetical protein
MNDLDLMTGFRADPPPPDQRTLGRARAQMFRAATKDRPRLVWRVAPAAGLAAALAVTAVVLRPAGSAQPPPTADGTGPASRPASKPLSESATVLRLAAAEARREPLLPARDDQFVYVESIISFAASASNGDGTAGKALPPQERRRRVWLSVDGTEDALARETPVTSHAAGSGGDNLGHIDGYRSDLPTDAKAMRTLLYSLEHGDGSADAGAFDQVGGLLREQYVAPASVAALFDAAATIPGTRVVRQVDLAGRHGIAVTRMDAGIRSDLIFDAKTYHFLGERDVVVGDSPPFAKGAVIGYTAQLRIRIVDAVGQLP